MKMEPIKIRRAMTNGLVMEVELTEDEVYRVFEHYEHHCDVEYTNNELSQRECKELTPLSEKDWAEAIHSINEEMYFVDDYRIALLYHLFLQKVELVEKLGLDNSVWNIRRKN